ncbi:MAG: helical backbone metal receptor [Thermoguttaceae bacterium]
MNTQFVHSLHAFVAVCVLATGCTRITLPECAGPPQRVISTAPSVTETLFAIGVGDSVVGVTRFCLDPPEAKSRRVIGDLLQPHWETILSLEPDLIITLCENESLVERAAEFHIPTQTVDHRSLAGILASIDELATPFGNAAVARAAVLRNSLEERLNTIATRTASRQRVRTLICVDRLHGTGRLQGLFVAGSNPFFADVLRIAGGENVVESQIAFPTLSLEAVLRLNPDVIIDLVTADGTSTPTVSDWEHDAAILDAVRLHRVFPVAERYLTIPGPRVVDLVTRIADILDAIPDATAPPETPQAK